jgi:hypothetical protein
MFLRHGCLPITTAFGIRVLFNPDRNQDSLIVMKASNYCSAPMFRLQYELAAELLHHDSRAWSKCVMPNVKLS